jgi:KaiC/GvpD/RAD55 family RecA-like ATPase
VLVFGAAGMGKTTFCQYVTYRWAEGKLFQQYKLLFWIKLRSLSSHLYQQRHQQPYTLVDIVKQECLKTFTVNEKEAETLRYIIENQPSEVLWLLDGYDEVKIPDHLKPQLDQCEYFTHFVPYCDVSVVNSNE